VCQRTLRLKTHIEDILRLIISGLNVLSKCCSLGKVHSGESPSSFVTASPFISYCRSLANPSPINVYCRSLANPPPVISYCRSLPNPPPFSNLMLKIRTIFLSAAAYSRFLSLFQKRCLKLCLEANICLQ